ncbi:chaperone protein HscB [Buchnera aphidicola (Cinara tujafilina)]|uniref:Co-chaperone protein HscB n=1 Tax=Buchnera aphidicola (Cinara tujafilina) TaxID=261317 RepID=F7WZS9_9GAMM|nr:Fe-S protein assembly co-chaperone HscB [Buchnera aphidicola]AEH39955.1 chaperone protein HscB [Buchnera aphidicola (Cinara tujafilina)]
MDYFTLFQIPKQFQINLVVLEKNFYLLQKKYHPDVYKKKNPSDSNNCNFFSAKINKAYNILKDKFSRAKYLLKIYKNENKIVNKNYIVTNSFLNKQFKLYEIIETFKIKKENIKNINNFIKAIENKINYYFLKIAQEFQLKKIIEAQKTLHYLFFKKKYYLKFKN